MKRETSALNRSYQYRKLITDEVYDDMSLFEQIGQIVKGTGYPVEKVYAWDYDFLPTLVILIALILALIFAGLKIANVIYDLVFIQLVAGIIIASDQRNSGRAKKVIQELLNSYLIFLICALLIKLFIGLSIAIVASNYDTFVKLILIIGFAKATIDAPDIIVKILGTDAGVKSGAATAMAVMGGVRTAQELGRTAVGLGSKATHFAEKASSAPVGGASGLISGGSAAYNASRSEGRGRVRSAANAVGGAVGGALVGSVSAVTGNRNEGSVLNRGSSSGRAFGERAGSNLIHRNSTNNIGRGERGERGSDGRQGERGERGEQGVRGEQGEQGERSMQGEQGVQGERGEQNSQGSSRGQGFNAPASSGADRAEAPAPENSRADAPEGGNQ